MHVVTHHGLDELETLATHEKRADRHLKWRAVILAGRGWTACEIADALGKGRRTIQDWIGHYNRDGGDGLIDRRGGNHRHLTDEQEQQLKDHIDTLADDPHQGVRHAAELIRHIEPHFGVRYALSGLYALLHRLGYSWLVPRPRHPKADPAAQAAFKKTPQQ